jgi:hypothetical protein
VAAPPQLHQRAPKLRACRNQFVPLRLPQVVLDLIGERRRIHKEHPAAQKNGTFIPLAQAHSSLISQPQLAPFSKDEK